MFRLSRITDYGIVLMAQLASHGNGASRNAREMAAETNLPLPVVSKILKCLKRDGLLASQRGARGGYTLSRPPAEISTADLIRVLEGPIGLTECTAHPGRCPQEESCHVREPWQQINQIVRDALARVKLSELARGSVVPPGATSQTLGLGSLRPDERAR